MIPTWEMPPIRFLSSMSAKVRQSGTAKEAAHATSPENGTAVRQLKKSKSSKSQKLKKSKSCFFRVLGLFDFSIFRVRLALFDFSDFSSSVRTFRLFGLFEFSSLVHTFRLFDFSDFSTFWVWFSLFGLFDFSNSVHTGRSFRLFWLFDALDLQRVVFLKEYLWCLVVWALWNWDKVFYMTSATMLDWLFYCLTLWVFDFWTLRAVHSQLSQVLWLFWSCFYRSTSCRSDWVPNSFGRHWSGIRVNSEYTGCSDAN